MKYIYILFTMLLVCSCSKSPRYTGQWFVEKSPSFYLSIAPTFDKPYEYEVLDNTLVYREYSGLGGYNWGSRKVVAKSDITREEQEKIRSLTLDAIADTISLEKKRSESGEFIVVLDGISWYIQSDVGPFLSIRTNNPESQAFNDLVVLLNSILEREPDDAYQSVELRSLFHPDSPKLCFGLPVNTPRNRGKDTRLWKLLHQ